MRGPVPPRVCPAFGGTGGTRLPLAQQSAVLQLGPHPRRERDGSCRPVQPGLLQLVQPGTDPGLDRAPL
ncbi:hypothetical protein GCM10010302_75440 [Streptomyces polychromogenes]|uniref:Uncharacterized protein n=1 Tax=Streptomyces polychromogenes TaxID=67342 RepID=A0ABN0W551_9ACTN